MTRSKLPPPPPRRAPGPPIKPTMPAPRGYAPDFGPPPFPSPPLPPFGGDEGRAEPPPFPKSEPGTSRRNQNVALMQQLIGYFDDLDEVNRELLVCVAHEILTAQNKRAL